MVLRRTVLKASGPLCAVSLAGCTGIRQTVKCRVDNDYDILILEPVAEDVATASDSVVVNYENLGPDAKDAVEKAVASEDDYRVCHQFGDGQSDVEKLLEFIESKWENADVEDADERTYLKYEGQYYGIVLTLLDVVHVSSTPE